MTVLQDSEIAREIGYGNLKIEPVDLEKQLQPCSLDIRLGDEVSWYKNTGQVIDTRKDNPEGELISEELPEDRSLLVEPQDFFLVNTEEYVEIPDYLECELRGRSSIGRLGIEVHSTAGLLDSGYKGEIVLEISNNSNRPVRLYRGQRIAQLIFQEMKGKASEPYGEKKDSKYQGQEGAVGSRVNQDYE